MANIIDDELAAPIFGIAFHHVLKPTEGIIVEYKGQKYIVHKDDEQVHISEADEEHAHLTSGQWVWLHNHPVGNA